MIHLSFTTENNNIIINITTNVVLLVKSAEIILDLIVKFLTAIHIYIHQTCVYTVANDLDRFYNNIQ